VNGTRWGGGTSRAIHHDLGRILERISASETVYPGEVIGSGTADTGCGLEVGRQLAPGDEIERELEKIGVLRNSVVSPFAEGGT
jgi:2-keto-4-pentenoate hydratase/2-oxohepta-3-ene-1,7-dioic acid hydratase in catechol pathway